MQFSKCSLSVAFLAISFFSAAQSSYMQQNSKHLHFIDRLEIKTGAISDLNFTTTKPYDRRYAVEWLGSKADSMLRIKLLFYNTDTALKLGKVINSISAVYTSTTRNGLRATDLLSTAKNLS